MYKIIINYNDNTKEEYNCSKKTIKELKRQINGVSDFIILNNNNNFLFVFNRNIVSKIYIIEEKNGQNI